MKRQAVILAGGKGTRLAERLQGRPKPLIDIDGVPLLGRQIELLLAHDFTDVLILVSHASDQIMRFCAERGYSDGSIRFLEDGDPKGTAGALLAARDQLSDRFLVMYGDTLVNVDLGRFYKRHEAVQADATLFLHPNDHPYDSDLVELDDEGWISSFHAYPHDPGVYLPNLVNAGLYVIERQALDGSRNFRIPSDIAKDLFPAMITAGAKLYGYCSFEYIKDIGTPDRLDVALGHLRSGEVQRAELTHPQKAVFVDRDGTLNEEVNHLSTAEQLHLFPGTEAAIKRLNDAEYRIAVVTNQPVLARGDCTFSEMRRIHNRLATELGRHRAFVDRIYLCPHHPHSGYPGEVPELKVRCNCRKPNIGLLTRAQSELNIDFAQSWLVGDTTTDMLAAARAGLRSILVKSGHAGNDGKYFVDPDFIVQDFAAAVEFILDLYPKLKSEVQSLATKITPGDLVLIGGLAKQGKSTFASALKCELRAAGYDPVVLHLDCFIKSAHERNAGVVGRYDLATAERALARWLKERCDDEIALPRYDRLRRLNFDAGDILKLRPDSVLILEGVPAFVLELPTIRNIHRIVVAGQEQTRRDRVINDLLSRGESLEDATLTYNQRCKDETLVIEELALMADAVWSFPS